MGSHMSQRKLLEAKEPEAGQLRVLDVPGIEVVIGKLRLTYPHLTDEAIVRILGLPSGRVSSASTKPGPGILTPEVGSENNT